MKRWLGFPSVQIALCVFAYALVGYYLGRMVVVWTAPVFAYAVSRPVMALMLNFRRRVREHVWLPVHGQHYVFRDITIHVEEDDDHWRWVCLADVQKVVGNTASERALAAAYPGRVQAMGTPAQAFMRDDALVVHLGKENQQAALKFRTWAERNIALPARRVRKKFGITTDPEAPGHREE